MTSLSDCGSAADSFWASRSLLFSLLPPPLPLLLDYHIL